MLGYPTKETTGFSGTPTRITISGYTRAISNVQSGSGLTNVAEVYFRQPLAASGWNVIDVAVAPSLAGRLNFVVIVNGNTSDNPSAVKTAFVRSLPRVAPTVTGVDKASAAVSVAPAPSGDRQVNVKIVGSFYVLSSGYLNVKNLLYDVLGAKGWNVTGLAADVGIISAPEYLLSLRVNNQYSNADVVNNLYADLAPYISNPRIEVVQLSGAPINPTVNAPNVPASGAPDSPSFAKGLGQGLGISTPLVIAGLVVFAVIVLKR